MVSKASHGLKGLSSSAVELSVEGGDLAGDNKGELISGVSQGDTSVIHCIVPDVVFRVCDQSCILCPHSDMSVGCDKEGSMVVWHVSLITTNETSTHPLSKGIEPCLDTSDSGGNTSSSRGV